MIKQQTGWSKYIIGIWWISDVLKQNTWSWKFIQVRACVCLIYIWHTWSLKSVIVARTLMKNRINDTSGGVSHSGQRELTVSQQNSASVWRPGNETQQSAAFVRYDWSHF